MNKIVLLFCVLAFGACINGYAQKSFDLVVETDTENINSISLHLPLDSILYETVYDHEFKRVADKAFLFKGQVNFASLFELKIDSIYYSQTFLIHPGKNKIKIIQVGREYKVLRLDDHREDQDRVIFGSWFENQYDIFQFLRRELNKDDTLGNKKVSTIMDSLLSRHYDRTDSTLYMVTKNNPQSYSSLWYLNQLLRFGYTPFMSDIFPLFDKKLQDSYLGKLTLQHLESKLYQKPGEVIPNGIFEDPNRNEMDLHTFVSTGKLTLINFWYSDCAPCIAKLPHLKEVFTQYQSKGFQMVSISTDRGEYIKKWKLAIEKHAISWLNLLDTKGLSESRYGVEVFPTSFLVDSTGKILKVNPSNRELEEVLVSALE